MSKAIKAPVLRVAGLGAEFFADTTFPALLGFVFIILSLRSRRSSRRNKSDIASLVICLNHDEKPGNNITSESHARLATWHFGGI
jgi:hypothetical protein